MTCRSEALPRLILAVLAVAILGLTGPAARGAAEAPADLDRRGVRWGALPISNYSTDRGWQLGGLAQRFDYGPVGARPYESLLTLQVSWATRGSRDVLIARERAGLDGQRRRFGLAAYFSDNPYQRYYGRGPDTVRDPAREDAGYNYFSYEEEGAGAYDRRALGESWDLQLGADAVRSVARAGESLYGRELGRAPRVSAYPRLSVGAIQEARSNEFSPDRGALSSLSLTGSPLGIDGAWARLDADHRRYFPLAPDRWLWLATQVRYAAATRDTPIVELPRLGSLGTLRGLPLSRYLDQHSLSLRAELRSVLLRERVFGLPLKGGIGAFTDLGRIASTAPGLFRGRNHAGYGFSVFGSYFTDDFVGSADYGFAEGTQAVYLRLGHAF